MYRGMRVAAFIPYGRELTVSILLPYLEREHDLGVLDELMLCMNTDIGQDDDVAYARGLAEAHDWINCYERPGPDTPAEVDIPYSWRTGLRRPKQLNTMRFYWYMTDRNTIYVRFDDDIVYVHPKAIRRLLDAEIDRPEVLATFPMIWNNAVCSNIGQQWGIVPTTWGPVNRHCVDPRGWADPVFAEQLHTVLLDAIDNGTVDSLLRNIDADLGWREQFSVSCFAIQGGEYADLGGVLDWDEEEHWLTMHRTGITGKGNIVRLNALVSHLSFYPQRQYLLEQTDVLHRYQDISDRVQLANLAARVKVTVVSPDGKVTEVPASIESRP